MGKQKSKNREKEMTHVMYKCLNGEGFHDLSLGDTEFLDLLAEPNDKRY